MRDVPLNALTLLPACVCGSTDGEDHTLHGLPVIGCRTCGVVRQHVALTPEEVATWYAHKYHATQYTHTYEHDRRVASLRAAAYALAPGARVLDVGCGNGAFVDELRARGYGEAWGQEVATQTVSPYVDVGTLYDCAYPTEAFDVVTLHDVLEHVPDLRGFLREVARIVRAGGEVIVDFPRFWHETGTHHWKAVEHLWMLHTEELVTELVLAGFRVTDVTHPIPSKVVVRAERRAPQRPSILVPAGIGDSYWVLTKLPGFLRAHGYGPDTVPAMYVQDAGGPKRTQPFLHTVPLVHAAGYVDTRKFPQFRSLWQEAYMRSGRTHYRDVCGVDHFLAYNGVMRHGASLAESDPAWGVEWRPRMYVSREAKAMRAELERDGPYVVAYFVSSGMYSHWLADFPPERILDGLRQLRDRVGRVVFVGAEWDRGSVGQWLAAQEPASASWVNLIGQTTYDELAGVLRGASGIVGWPSGASLLGPVWNVPTVLVWNRYFRREFWRNSAPPDAPYVTLDSRQLTGSRMALALADLIATTERTRGLR